MKDILDSTFDKTSPIYRKLVLFKRVEYLICFLNGLALILFFMNCIFDPDSLSIYFFAGSGLILFLSQIQLIYIYFWRKSFNKYKHTVHTFKDYHLMLRWGQIILLIWGLVLMLVAIAMFISYSHFSSINEMDYYPIVGALFELYFFLLSLLYIYYNIQSKQLSNWKPFPQ